MARHGETEHGSAGPGATPMSPAGDEGASDARKAPVGPPAYPPPAYPPPAYPPPAYPPPAYPPPAYPPPAPNREPGEQSFPPYGALHFRDEHEERVPSGSGRPVPPPSGDGQRFFDRPGTPPATKRIAGFWLVMGFAGFALGEVVGSIFVAVAAAAAGESGQLGKFASMASPPEWYVGTSLVGLWVGFFLGPWVASKARGTGRFLRDLGVRFRLVDLAGIPIGIGGQLVLDALYAPFLPQLKHFTAPTQKLVGAAHGWGYLVIAILIVCGAPFFEEILFRGVALKALARLFAPAGAEPTRRRAVAVVGAVVVDGILFGLAHWELYQFAGLAVFGMALAAVSYKTGRLGMNMVAHASFNLVAVLALVATSGGLAH